MKTVKHTENKEIKTLAEFVKEKEMFNAAKKRYDELRSEIIENIKSGQYGPYTVMIDAVECPEYLVKAHTKTNVKVSKS